MPLRFKAPSKEELNEIIISAFNQQAKSALSAPYETLKKEDQDEVRNIGSFMAFEIYYELSKRIEPELTKIIKAASDLAFPSLGTDGTPLRAALLQLSQLNPGTLVPGHMVPLGQIEDYFSKGSKVMVEKNGMPLITEILEGKIGPKGATFTILDCDNTYQLSQLLFFEKEPNQPSQQEEVKRPKGV